MHACYGEDVARFLAAVNPPPSALLGELEAEADRSGFPIVGPDVGAFLRLCARLVSARSAFEFGSGFGYSALWVAPALPADGRIVLTEVDADRLDRARDHLERADVADRAAFERGDAVETVGRYDGPFDLVLIDNENWRYVEAFEAVRDKVRPGGLVIADNVITATGPLQPDRLLALVEGDDPGGVDRETGGIADYLDHVRGRSGWETAALPIGEGLAASVRLG